ncbi:Uncharacterized membrane protein YfcA [Loktanella fryxellensis]|uniref:Probable membrane transporter protein n=1 Tax=Loktanella fryxellensis TaxID=245187 RepID=A0A1H8IU66_9RHOB|nr:sulfite exporter TauE/SafE family protein [Loktanella fryxellensis]SEN72320.1 Uncharacterized membrane protein YfcA [Loktanella fryxellensis]
MIAGIDPGELVPVILAMVIAGGLIGVLAGLFGVGGGAVSVPVFYEFFGITGIPDDLRMPLAVGTSLALIVPTSILSVRSHYQRGTVDMDLLRIWVVPILLGVVIGAVIARFSPPAVFQIVFIVVASINAAKLLTGGKGWRLGDTLPGPAATRVAGGVIGLLSSLMGIGGGAISNLFMTLHGVGIHRAVSTSAGVGVLIAIPGTIGYMLAGWDKPGLPVDAIGYVSLIAFILTLPSTLLTTPLGVRLAHGLRKNTLEKLFGSFLLLVSVRFLYALIAV